MEDVFLKGIIANFKEQYALYARVRDLAVEQKKCLSGEGRNGQIDQFIQLLQQRKDIMDKISGINEENMKLRRTWTDISGLKSFTLSEMEGKVNKEDLEEIRRVVNELNGILLEISEIDDKNSAVLRDMAYRGNKTRYRKEAEAKKLYNKVMRQNNG